MANNLIRSNRKNNDENFLKPQKKVTVSDLNVPVEKKTVEVNRVSFNTNLKISNHSRNKLQSMVNLGHADSQKDAIDILFECFVEDLTESEKKEIELQIDILEKRDAKTKQKKP